MADPETLYNLLKELFFILDDGDRQLFGRYNLTVPRVFALLHLGEQPGMSLSQLSDMMLCDKSNITRIIKGMEGDGLVRRQPHESDGRTLRLHLTEKGESVRTEVLASHAAYNQLRFQCIDTILQGNLLEGLQQLKEGLRGQLGDEVLGTSTAP
jgi:DNA-binding MarR family transcriptional regulator